jgi:AraC family transcriptional regulator, melibiose operon regulatory protein
LEIIQSMKNLSVPTEATSDNPLIVFEDHNFCAGIGKDVMLMPSPHMHSQIELNYVTEGFMTYRFDGRTITVEAGDFVFFWGTVPHQVIEKAEVTKFVCLYLPLSSFRNIAVSDLLNRTLLSGGLIKASRMLSGEENQFDRWHNELLSHDSRLEHIVHDELIARIRRVDIDGWVDLRAIALSAASLGAVDGQRLQKAEAMALFISEHGDEEITVDDVAACVGLHPNYAMSLFRKSLGLTINQFITRTRLDAAQALLVSSEKDVADVAFQCGFGSLSRFYDAFQHKFGISPAKFRKLHFAPGRQALGKAT